MSLVKVTESSYNDAYALADVFNYCGKMGKCIYWDGLGVCLHNIRTAMDSMRIIKRSYGKDSGKQLHHVIISIYRDMYVKNEQELKNKKSTERICRSLIGMEICEYIYNLGFQNVYFLHDDAQYVHLHILVNSVSYMNGIKLTNLYSFRNNIEQCLKNNYPFLQWL